jgi:hypothetical protein
MRSSTQFLCISSRDITCERRARPSHCNYQVGFLTGFHSDASFAENFYGLKRRRRPFFELERKLAAVGGVPEGEKLRMREVNRSLLFLVRGPVVPRIICNKCH